MRSYVFFLQRSLPFVKQHLVFMLLQLFELQVGSDCSTIRNKLKLNYSRIIPPEAEHHLFRIQVWSVVSTIQNKLKLNYSRWIPPDTEHHMFGIRVWSFVSTVRDEFIINHPRIIPWNVEHHLFGILVGSIGSTIPNELLRNYPPPRIIPLDGEFYFAFEIQILQNFWLTFILRNDQNFGKNSRADPKETGNNGGICIWVAMVEVRVDWTKGLFWPKARRVNWIKDFECQREGRNREVKWRKRKKKWGVGRKWRCDE